MHRRAVDLEALGQILPASRFAIGEAERLTYSRDMWPRTLLSVQANHPSVAPPDVVVWPESTDEVAALVRFAAERQIPLVPWGAGSGVCGGAMAIRGGMTVDLKRMNRVVAISSEDHLATFEAGIIGQILEDELNLRGLTLGHFPSSIYCSTLGGWVATRSAGQLSSRYGKIEDMVESLEVVVGDGSLVRCGAHERPDLLQLVVGSEGTLGVITAATLKVQPLPVMRVLRAYRFPRMAAGCEGIRQVMQRGLRPAVLRLYDEMDSLVARSHPRGHAARDASRGAEGTAHSGHARAPSGSEDDGRLRRRLLTAALSHAGVVTRMAEAIIPCVGDGCLLITGFEGDPLLVEVEASLAHAELVRAGGRDLGESRAVDWYLHRYAVSYKQSPVFRAGAFVDTMELATTWDRLLELYETVGRALSRRAVVLAHFSHAYPEGCSIYFTFAAAARSSEDASALYDDLWQRGLTAALRAGGTISHHHGVGYSKSGFMAEEHGEALPMYRQIKRVLDPSGILNPAKMGL